MDTYSDNSPCAHQPPKATSPKRPCPPQQDPHRTPAAPVSAAHPRPRLSNTTERNTTTASLPVPTDPPARTPSHDSWPSTGPPTSMDIHWNNPRYNGLPGEHYRPMVFSLPVSPVLDNRPNRWLVIQRVFSDANTEYLRPHMAVWRSAGLDAGFGNAGAALLLTKLYIYECHERWRAADPNCEWICYSFLSVHKVDIKAPAKSPPGAGEPRRGGSGRGRGRNPSTNARATDPTPPAPADPGPTQAHYGEFFIITVCTAPISQISHCFESFIPPGAAFGLPLYPIRFFFFLKKSNLRVTARQTMQNTTIRQRNTE